MANLKALRSASFRGVAFKVFTSDAAFGRRTVNHEFVKRDTPYQEDLGRKAQTFNVEAFVIGSDYQTERDALISACETEGPGQLVHPFYGTKTVTVISVRVREAAGEQGMARIDFEFIEAGKLTFPKSVVDPISSLSDTVDGFREKAATDFLSKFNVLGKAQFVVNSAQSKVTGVADAISTQTSKVSTLSTSVTDLAFSIRNLKADAADLVNEPASLRSSLSSAMRQLTGVVGSKDDSVKLYSGFYGYGKADQVSPFTTNNRMQENKNSGAINDLISREALCQAAIDASLIKFRSDEDANAARESLFEELENQKNSADDDDIYSSLLELKAKIGDAIPPAPEKLPSIVTLTLPASSPSLALAYSLYGSLDREEDIIARNHISNPAFLPGGVPLKVLNDG